MAGRKSVTSKKREFREKRKIVKDQFLSEIIHGNNLTMYWKGILDEGYRRGTITLRSVCESQR